MNSQSGLEATGQHVGCRVGVRDAPQPVLAGKTARPMRYTPEDGGFVITNGQERFNRPLYIGRNGARLDAGDRPELALYLPGKGGVLRLGVAASDRVKWLLDADRVMARYAEGRMIYTVSDTMLGEGELVIDAVPANDRTAALVQVSSIGNTDAELIWSFGGATGSVDFRGDIGYTDIAEHYGLQPEQCANSRFSLDGSRFVLRAGTACVSGVVSSAVGMRIGDAAQWERPEGLLASEGDACPVVTGRVSVSADSPFCLALIRGEDKTLDAEELPGLFAASVAAKQAAADQISVDTPDPYVNAAVSALNAAADALFDGDWYMHGNVAQAHGRLALWLYRRCAGLAGANSAPHRQQPLPIGPGPRWTDHHAL